MKNLKPYDAKPTSTSAAKRDSGTGRKKASTRQQSTSVVQDALSRGLKKFQASQSRTARDLSRDDIVTVVIPEPTGPGARAAAKNKSPAKASKGRSERVLGRKPHQEGAGSKRSKAKISQHRPKRLPSTAAEVHGVTTERSKAKKKEARRRQAGISPFSPQWHAVQRIDHMKRVISATRDPHDLVTQVRKMGQKSVFSPEAKTWLRVWMAVAGLIPKSGISPKIASVSSDKLYATLQKFSQAVAANKTAHMHLQLLANKYMTEEAGKPEDYKAGDALFQKRKTNPLLRWKGVPDALVKSLFYLMGQTSKNEPLVKPESNFKQTSEDERRADEWKQVFIRSPAEHYMGPSPLKTQSPHCALKIERAPILPKPRVRIVIQRPNLEFNVKTPSQLYQEQSSPPAPPSQQQHFIPCASQSGFEALYAQSEDDYYDEPDEKMVVPWSGFSALYDVPIEAGVKYLESQGLAGSIVAESPDDVKMELKKAGVEQNPGPYPGKTGKMGKGNKSKRPAPKIPRARLTIIRRIDEPSEVGRSREPENSRRGLVVQGPRRGPEEPSEPAPELPLEVPPPPVEPAPEVPMLPPELPLVPAPLPSKKYVFHGRYDLNESTYEPSDPVNRVERFVDGTYVLDIEGCSLQSFRVPIEFERMAGHCGICSDPQLNMRNIRTAFRLSMATQGVGEENPFDFLQATNVVAFVLAGIIHGSGRMRWLNDVPELVPVYYTCPCPTDANKRLRQHQVYINPDLNSVQAKYIRKTRAAPYRVSEVVAHLPAYWDPSTLKAGLLRRLFPLNPKPTESALTEIVDIALQLAEIIEQNTEGRVYDRQQLFTDSLWGRPAREAEPMRLGFADFLRDPPAAIAEYTEVSYKSFDKIEHLSMSERKPPRFIMSLPCRYRGMQSAAMAVILRRIEDGTALCNVKHRTPEQVTQMVERKFEDHPYCMETDFTSFESCITPEIKFAIENLVFYQLATEQFETWFIRDALDREHVRVRGDGWNCQRFHHIRMSGDLWTSIGNLLTNMVVMSYVLEMSIHEIMLLGVFEGDDGMIAVPQHYNAERVQARAISAGMNLKFKTGPWRSLSFCGNNFQLVDGKLLRRRDPLRTLASLTAIFNAECGTSDHDRMLQRSKALSILSGPWVPGASAFAAAVELLTRDVRVKESYLRSHSLLRTEFSPYALEGCVPDWLKRAHSHTHAAYLINDVDLKAGGTLGFFETRKMISQLYHHGVTDVVPFAFDRLEGSWLHRDGLKHTTPNRFTVRHGMFSLWHYDYRAQPSYFRLVCWLTLGMSGVILAVLMVKWSITGISNAAATAMDELRNMTEQLKNQTLQGAHDMYEDLVNATTNATGHLQNATVSMLKETVRSVRRTKRYRKVRDTATDMWMYVEEATSADLGAPSRVREIGYRTWRDITYWIEDLALWAHETSPTVVNWWQSFHESWYWWILKNFVLIPLSIRYGSPLAQLAYVLTRWLAGCLLSFGRWTLGKIIFLFQLVAYILLLYVRFTFRL